MDRLGEDIKNKHGRKYYSFILRILMATLLGIRLPYQLKITDTLIHINMVLGDENNPVYLKCLYNSGESLNMVHLEYHRNICALRPDLVEYFFNL